MTDVLGLVLGGGRGTRFGADKFFHEIDQVAMGKRAIDALESVADEVRVVGRQELPTGWGGVPVWGWREGSGPLGAILDGIEASDPEIVITLPCDMPFFDAGCVRQLLECLTDGVAEAIFAADHSEDVQWLAGAWNARVLSATGRHAFQTGIRSVHEVAELVEHGFCLFSPRSLTNVNEGGDR